MPVRGDGLVASLGRKRMGQRDRVRMGWRWVWHGEGRREMESGGREWVRSNRVMGWEWVLGLLQRRWRGRL